ncbi:hypothetical protein B0T25DRAFT_549070 [Lasiosphaeria hispida]|uniref:Uncharacterized protein n=1 Tax=Lasiosphaeria hispida TaxID=260671 RepID=A0AAJ0HFX4_9PEZI|nr:hypothetical protein B0T25DRAFT_549070 [Lasiosphaeria hispida]
MHRLFGSKFKNKQNAMPSRNLRQEDPFRRINSWDDGYEYIQSTTPSPPSGRTPAPFYSPPPMASNPARGAPHGPDHGHGPMRDDFEPYSSRAYPPPPSDSEERRRRRYHRDPSPPPYRAARAPSPPPAYRSTRSPSPPYGRRDAGPPPISSRPRARRPSPDSRGAAPLARSRSMREARPQRSYTRSPSPPPRRRDRDRDMEWNRERPVHRAERRRSPSPMMAGARHRDRDWDSGRRRDPSPRAPRRSGRYGSPSPLPRSQDRPPIGRSKSTSAKERFAGLSPRWQHAATAALQAGGLAAIQMRSQPGGWKGEKGARVASAALGAAAMDAFAKKNKAESGGGRREPSRGRRSGGVEAMGGALGGFLIDQLSKQKSKSRH